MVWTDASDDFRPSDDAYFGDAEAVLLPKRPASDDEYFLGLKKTYGRALESRFQQQAESERWILYRRR